MGNMTGVIFMTIVAPIWIVSHYVTKWRLAKGLSSDEARTLEELWQTARRMEERVETLEAILDKNVDGWRNKT